MPSVLCFDTKPNLDDQHFEQKTGDILHLSGCTVIRGQLKICSSTGFTSTSGAGPGNLWTSNASGVGSWQIGSAERIKKQITKVSHGFNVNDVIGWSGGTYNKAIANGTYNGEIIGITNKCIDNNNFELTQAGYVTGLTSLSINTTYFLSDVTPGLLTSVAPTGITHVVKSMMIADSSTSGWILPYVGYVIASGTTAISSTLVCCSNASMPNNSLFYSTNCNTLVYKNPAGVTCCIAFC